MIKQFLFKSIGLFFNVNYFFFPKLATKWAIYVFSTPQRKPIREKEAEFLKTAQITKRAVGDLPIVEYQWGNPTDPLIVLSYGWEYNAGRWRYFVPVLLEAGYRVVAYDPPGHGNAPNGQMNIPRNAVIIRDLILKNGQPEAIVAHSFGGGSSVFALHELPERYHPKRLVIMAAFSYAPRIFREFAKALGVTEALYYRVVRTFEQNVGRRLEEFDFARMAGDLHHVSGLLVHSPGDDVTPYAEAQRFFNFWDGAALLSPEKGGHHLGTAETTKAVLDFAISGKLPEKVEVQHFPVEVGHDLVRYFPGM